MNLVEFLGFIYCFRVRICLSVACAGLIGALCAYITPVSWEAVGMMRMAKVGGQEVENIQGAVTRIRFIESAHAAEKGQGVRLSVSGDYLEFHVRAEERSIAQRKAEAFFSEFRGYQDRMMAPAITSLQKKRDMVLLMAKQLASSAGSEIHVRDLIRQANDLDSLLRMPSTSQTQLVVPVMVVDRPVSPGKGLYVVAFALLGLALGLISSLIVVTKKRNSVY